MKLIFNTLNGEKILESTLPGRIFFATVGVLFIALVGASCDKIKASYKRSAEAREMQKMAVKWYIENKSFPILNGNYNKNKTFLMNLIDFDLYNMNDICKFIDSSRYMYSVGVSSVTILNKLDDKSDSINKLIFDISNRECRVLYNRVGNDCVDIIVLEENKTVYSYRVKDGDVTKYTMYDDIEDIFYDEIYTTYNYMVKIKKIKENE